MQTKKKTPKSKAGNRRHIMARYLIIIAAILTFSVIIGVKLYHNTVRDAEHWNEKAEALVTKSGKILPKRGDILAADGSIMVTNLTFFNVRLDYAGQGFRRQAFKDSLDLIAADMANVFPHRTASEWKAYLEEPLSRDTLPTAYPLLVRITDEQYKQLRRLTFFRQPNRTRTGLVKEEVVRRRYPYGDMARLSLGQAAQNGSSTEVHGVSGLERALDGYLYGENGTYKRVPFTRSIGRWADIPAKDGYDVTTTIDISLQDLVETELAAMVDSCNADWGSAILMEVATGEIKAISNVEHDENGNLVEAYNRAVIGFEPGSVVKPISMMFALEKGLVNNLDEPIYIGPSFAYGGGKPITDSHAHGTLTVRQIIEQSSNIGMTKVIIRGFDHNPKGFVKCFEDIGFFEDMGTGIFEAELPRIKRDPCRVDMSRMCYGYATALPPIYTLSVYNAMANGGRYVRPRLVKALSHDGVIDTVFGVSYIRDRICSEENAAKMREMLAGVVERGTAKSIKNPYVKLAGKTGTAYNYNYEKSKGPIGYQTSKKRLAFCGFFPADNPKYSCMVLMFYPKQMGFGAASTSGRTFKNIALKMYARGLLGDTSDFTAEAPGKPATPRIYATTGTENYSDLMTELSRGNRIGQYRAPSRDADSVPSVTNLGIRDAIARLEQAGYDVAFNGTGRVYSQSYDPVTNTVHLSLTNK